MIDRKAHAAGIFTPSQVALLARVFERTAVEGETDEEREARAIHIINLYTSGLTDEDALVEASKPGSTIIS